MPPRKRIRVDEGDRPLSASERTGGGDPGDAQVPLIHSQKQLEPSAALEVLDNAPCGLVVMALDGSLLWANQHFLRLTGSSAKNATEVRFHQFLGRSGSIYYETHFLPVLLLRGVLQEVSFEIVSTSGERTPVLVNATLDRAFEGKSDKIHLAVFDASERRRYEQDLLYASKEAERMAEVVRRSTDAIMALEPDGKIQGWNHGAELIFGYSADEAIGKELLNLIFSPERMKDVIEATSTLKQGNDFLTETVCTHKSGREIEVSINFTPHLEAPGTLVAYSAIIRDATSRRIAERVLLVSEKLASVGRLASSIAHEINNPLESVTNLLYILETQVKEPSSKSLVRTAQEELARVSQITTQTLRFHRQSSNKSLVDIKALLESILALYRGRMHNSNIVPIFVYSNSSPLFCFESELRQILTHLVGNAVDSMRGRGGRLQLRTQDATLWAAGKKGVRITIADDGCGMDKATLARIFEPFFTTKGIGGTGLGLWISQDLVAKNLGLIQVRTSDSQVKHGTVFVMSFPHIEQA
jgi:PAS domain S-box-containing protein